MAIPEESYHVADARLIGDVLLHHSPIFVDKLIGAMTALFLSDGNEGIAVHGQCRSQEFPVAGMGGHENRPLPLFLSASRCSRPLKATFSSSFSFV